MRRRSLPLQVPESQGRLGARQAQALSQYLEFPIAPEHHLQYAATWVTLATATAIIARRAITAPARQNLRRQQMAGAAAASDARKTTTS